MKAKWRQSITPIHWLYLVIHLAFVAFGILLVQSKGSPIQFSIGTSLLATGITGWAVFVYILLHDSLRDRVELAQLLRIKSYFSSRGSSIRNEYERRLINAKSSIDILGFGQRALLEDYQSKFVEWKLRAKVRILLLDPDYPSASNAVADLRDLDENQTVGTISNEVKQFIRNSSALHGAGFHIRLYRCLPSVNIFRVDDEMFWGPYFIRKVSRNSPTFVVERGGDLYDELLSHFETIWRDDSLSREVPPGWRAT